MADEPTTPTEAVKPAPTPADVATAAPADKATPPWGSDAEFDAEKAWRLVQNLRAELAEVKTARDEATEKAAGLEKSSADLKASADKAAAEAEELRASAAAEATARAKERLLSDAGLDPAKFSQFLTGDDEAGWRAAAQTLADLKTDTNPVKSPALDPAQVAAPVVDERAALANQIFGA